LAPEFKPPSEKGIRRAPFALALGLALALLATIQSGLRADIVHLKSGGRVEGRIVKQTPTQVHVRTKFGAVLKLPRSQIERIERKRDVWDEYEKRRAKVKPTDAKGLFTLYEWCLENGLKREADTVLEEVLQADPNHTEAHRVKGEVKIAGKWMTPAAAKAAGYELHDGKWLTHDEIMKATGHVRWGSRWITESEYDRLKVKTDMESILNMELTVVNSEHFGVRTRFPEDHARKLLDYAETAYDEFMRVLPYPKESLKRWRRVQIYLFSNLEEYQVFIDKYIWPRPRRYIKKEAHYLYYREAGNCNFYYPLPIVALRPSPAIPKFKDQAALAIHNVGHVLLHRMRREIYPPDWLEEALGHYLEEKVFGHCRIFCMMPGKLSRRELIVPGWRNSNKWKQQMNRLLVSGEVPAWKVLMKKPLGGITTKELAKVYAVLRMILKKKPGSLHDFLMKATKHSWEKIFEETIGWSPEQVDQELAQYIKENY